MINVIKNVVESVVEFTSCVAISFGIIGVWIAVAEFILLY